MHSFNNFQGVASGLAGSGLTPMHMQSNRLKTWATAALGPKNIRSVVQWAARRRQVTMTCTLRLQTTTFHNYYGMGWKALVCQIKITIWQRKVESSSSSLSQVENGSTYKINAVNNVK